jgi:hypothetical protein
VLDYELILGSIYSLVDQKGFKKEDDHNSNFPSPGSSVDILLAI